MCIVSFVNVQCSETRSLAANRSLRVSILLAEEGNTMEGRFVLPAPFTKCLTVGNQRGPLTLIHTYMGYNLLYEET
mgnify:CR=1 FL=1